MTIYGMPMMAKYTQEDENWLERNNHLRLSYARNIIEIFKKQAQ